jgi:hypothetical protein
VDLSGQRRGAGRALRGERGQTSAEYVGIILVVVAILAAISSADIGAAISVQVERAVCQIAADGDGGVECKGAGASTEKRSGARARPAPNLYDAEATPKLAGLDARSPKFVATGASAQAATRTASLSPGDLAPRFINPLPPPLPPEVSDPFLKVEKELSGFNDAKKTFEALAEGRYGEALVPGILALPWFKALKVGKKVLEKGAEKLGPQAKKLWKKLSDERGSVGLPRRRPAAGGLSDRASQRIANRAKKRGVRIYNSHLAGKRHPVTGVPFKPSGFPDFTPYARLINGRKNLRVKGLTGDQRKDRILANKAAGLKEEPPGFLWNHVEDGKTMQLVPRQLHRDTAHTGGAKLLERGVVKPAR